jgi:hypothetical protein
MKLEKICKEDLIFSMDIEDDRTNTYLQLNDYDWMDYNLTTRFKTEKMGVLDVKFMYYGTNLSAMEVEQTLGDIHQKIRYEYPTELFKIYITKFLEKHIKFWDEKYAFNGEEIVISFFNDVVDKGIICK